MILSQIAPKSPHSPFLGAAIATLLDVLRYAKAPCFAGDIEHGKLNGHAKFHIRLIGQSHSIAIVVRLCASVSKPESTLTLTLIQPYAHTAELDPAFTRYRTQALPFHTIHTGQAE